MSEKAVRKEARSVIVFRCTSCSQGRLWFAVVSWSELENAWMCSALMVASPADIVVVQLFGAPQPLPGSSRTFVFVTEARLVIWTKRLFWFLFLNAS